MMFYYEIEFERKFILIYISFTTFGLTNCLKFDLTRENKKIEKIEKQKKIRENKKLETTKTRNKIKL
jgi:hypothetical protein